MSRPKPTVLIELIKQLTRVNRFLEVKEYGQCSTKTNPLTSKHQIYWFSILGPNIKKSVSLILDMPLTWPRS
jgi:hypothetical protein